MTTRMDNKGRNLTYLSVEYEEPIDNRSSTVYEKQSSRVVYFPIETTILRFGVWSQKHKRLLTEGHREKDKHSRRFTVN